METPFINFVQKFLPDKELVGAEIGVRQGQNALFMWDNLNLKKLYLVDNWLEYTDGWDGIYAQETQDKIYEKLLVVCWTLEQLKKYKKETLEVMKMDSLRAAALIEDNSLDFVYIDSNHDYEHVKEDLLVWNNKVKYEGIIGGHDYGYLDSGVKQAVDEFAEQTKYNLNILSTRPGDLLGIEWAFIKK